MTRSSWLVALGAIAGCRLSGDSDDTDISGACEGRRLDAHDADVVFSGGPSGELNGTSSVAIIPDADGDGRADLAVGIPGSGGAVYLISGGSAGEQGPSDAFATITGDGGAGEFGGDLAGGDIDGDGVGDLLVGDPFDSRLGEWAGAVTLVSGPFDAGRRVVLHEIQGDARAGNVAVLGDLTGDGVDDFAIGSGRGSDYHGATYFLSGFPDEDASIRDVAVAAILGDADDYAEQPGRVGDLDGDGRDELAVGAIGVGHFTGGLYLFQAAPSGTISVHEADALLMGVEDDLAGYDTSGAADVDGDGRDDFAVSAPGHNVGDWDNTGRVYVVSGTNARDGMLEDLALAIIDGRGEDTFMQEVALGDVSCDGKADLLVGGPYPNAEGEPGTAWLFDGAVLSGMLDIHDATFELTGDNGDMLGWDVALGDLDGDGRADIVAAAPGEYGSGDAASAYLFYGSSL